MSDQEPKKLITTIERATDVLALFARTGTVSLGVTEIANELQLSKAVVHRVLTTLVAKGFVETDEASRRYRLGPMALALGTAYLEHLDVRALALPHLRHLSSRTGETATVSLRYGWERLYVDQVTPEREVRMTVVVGRAFPLHAGSSSKAFLAFLTQDEQERYLRDRELAPLTDRTIVDINELRAEIDAIRARGYATSSGERQADAGSIAAPVLDHRGQPAAVISLCGPLERFEPEADRFSGMLLEVTRELSRQLGYRAELLDHTTAQSNVTR